MPKLPNIKPKELVKILKKKGFVELRQSGSHLHNKNLKRKTLSSILKQAKIKL